jgi:hypothetical protein
MFESSKLCFLQVYLFQRNEGPSFLQIIVLWKYNTFFFAGVFFFWKYNTFFLRNLKKVGRSWQFLMSREALDPPVLAWVGILWGFKKIQEQACVFALCELANVCC